jgi:hypothetical protein
MLDLPLTKNAYAMKVGEPVGKYSDADGTSVDEEKHGLAITNSDFERRRA